METVGQVALWSFISEYRNAISVTNTRIRKDPGYSVSSYLDLATKVAELQFRNRDLVLLFRGQSTDHLNHQRHTSIKPSLLRAGPGQKGNPDPEILRMRFSQLQRADQELVARYVSSRLLGFDRLRRYRSMRWSILQHYEVCPTPLLDVTHSLRIAASFASIGAHQHAYVLVLGVPNLSGAITACAEASIETIRLSSVCPPCAVRPHIQEGYLLGEYPEVTGFEQKAFYKPHEIDFGRRLVAKFRFCPGRFWKGDDFRRISKHALHPDAHDPLHRLTQEVKNSLPSLTSQQSTLN
jgi:hypothetical protein